MSIDTTTVIIGAGQAGLAFSHCLAEAGIDHVIIERGQVANSWRTERWDSLRLLTPNWQSRLPGFPYRGPDPDGFMTMPEIGDRLAAYSQSFAAPVHEHTTVQSVEPSPLRDGWYEVRTDRGTWRARCVVIATGAFRNPAVPAVSAHLPRDVFQLAPSRYRNPDQLPDGGVLVVGASASGVQLADEIARSGRQVTLAAGDHNRMPRTYRGLDIQWWLDATGMLDVRYDRIRDIERARRAPSLQLIGSDERRTIDFATLGDVGVRIAGRLDGADESGHVTFDDSLPASIARAERVLNRHLDAFDQHAATCGLDTELDPITRPAPIALAEPPERLDLRREGIATVIWATGFRPRYPWLRCPVLDRSGAIRHDGGVVLGAPGLYVMGLPFMRRRKSSFIDGVGDDARDLSAHLIAALRRPNRPSTPAFRAA